MNRETLAGLLFNSLSTSNLYRSNVFVNSVTVGFYIGYGLSLHINQRNEK